MHFLISLLTVFVGEAVHDLNVHVSFQHGDGIGLSWQSPMLVECDTVHYGTSRDDLSKTQRSQRDCNLYKGDKYHHTVLNDLESGREFFYRISCSYIIRSFRTPPRPGSSLSFRFGVYADLGPVHGEATIAALHRMRDDLVGHIFAGDVGYADDAFLHSEGYIARTNEFMKALAASSERLPIMVSPGNHEAEDHTPVCLLSPNCRSGLGNFTAFNCIWNMPSEGNRHSMWSSFNYGPIHFVMSNTETDYEGAPLEGYGEVGFIPAGSFGRKGEYEDWLRRDLIKAESERHIRPWIVVVGHRPVTVLDDHSDPFVTPLNQRILDLITAHADAYIAGHVHYYARSAPKPTSHVRTHFITVGGAGCDEWPERRIQDTRKGETELFEYFGFGDEQTFGTLAFDHDKPDELVFELQTSAGGKVIDRVVIPKRPAAAVEHSVILTQ